MKKILFVCSGNTCRSPMAEGLFNELAKKESIPYVAVSAGLFTEDGLDYSSNSVEALKECGITLLGSSKKITYKMMLDCEYIFGLTSTITYALYNAFSDMKDKIYPFPVEVPDPYGGDINDYRNARDTIMCGIKEIIKNIG